MVIFDIESSLESSVRGGGGATGGDDVKLSFLSSVSSYLEGSDQDADVGPVSPMNNSGEDSGLQSSEFGGDRFLFSIPIHLLKGGVPIDVIPLLSVGGLPVLWGYDRVSHYVSLHVSDYYTQK